MALLDFWLYVQPMMYPDICKTAIKYLMIFTTTCLCESTLSALVHMKNKYRNRLYVEADLRLKRSSLMSDLIKLAATKQSQPTMKMQHLREK